jgi:hypothetical protein
MSRGASSTAAALAVALLLACASAPRSERTVLAGGRDPTVLVLPFNLAAAMPPELEAGSPVVWKELAAYLRAHGKRLKTVSVADARRLWLESIRRVRAGTKGARAGYDDAARLLVLELAKHAEFDRVIAPSLFVRNATIARRSAAWDGVEHSVEVEWSGDGAEGLPDDVELAGLAPAASLHAVVLDANGEKLQEGVGGLALLVRVRVSGGSAPGSPRSFAFARRADPFANRARLREGIAQALVPFLPPLRPEPE